MPRVADREPNCDSPARSCLSEHGPMFVTSSCKPAVFQRVSAADRMVPEFKTHEPLTDLKRSARVRHYSEARGDVDAVISHGCPRPDSLASGSRSHLSSRVAFELEQSAPAGRPRGICRRLVDVILRQAAAAPFIRVLEFSARKRSADDRLEPGLGSLVSSLALTLLVFLAPPVPARLAKSNRHSHDNADPVRV